MTSFVAFFSTEQDKLGYFVIGSHGTAPSQLTGGPLLAAGKYKLEGGTLVALDSISATLPSAVESI